MVKGLARLVALAALGALAGASSAQTGTGDLNILNSNYNTIHLNRGGVATYEGGGNIWSVTWKQGALSAPTTLDALYCVDLKYNVTVPGDYANTVATSNGAVHVTSSNTAGALVHNAGEVDWLMTHYAADAGLQGGNYVKQAALQAAIWTVIYENDTSNKITVNSTESYYTQYAAVLAALSAANLSDKSHPAANSSWLWFSPRHSATDEYQGLIGGSFPPPGGGNATPEASSLLLLLPGLLPLGLLPRRRKA